MGWGAPGYCARVSTHAVMKLSAVARFGLLIARTICSDSAFDFGITKSNMWSNPLCRRTSHAWSETNVFALSSQVATSSKNNASTVGDT